MGEPALEELGHAFAERVRTWKEQHPQATLQDMDQAVLELTWQLHAQTVSTLAAHEPEADWAGRPAAERPCCPTCAVPLRPHGKRQRQLQGYGGEPIILDRTYGSCPQCQAGFFPPG